jgi:FPC/CPF motif-containing protein YcgG
MLLLTRKDVKSISQESWKYKVLHEFESIITDPLKSFPCTLGVAGFAADQLRFAFIDHDVMSASAAEQLAATLQTFVPISRSFGKNTSLVVFFTENRAIGTEGYKDIFWSLLNKLHALDSRQWPATIPRDSNDKDWEFSFAGEPIFVVCNTPSHKVRMSRYASTFMITFQPRWVFDGVIGKNAPNADKIKLEIRRRLHIFDSVSPSPDLGTYGDSDNREWKQYFLGEDNKQQGDCCPFHHHSSAQRPTVQQTGIVQLPIAIHRLLPPTGSVEVQVDTPFRTHTRHQHKTDETLHIVKGEINFQLDGESILCKAGDRLLLPANTPHASTAGEDGCLYVIATRLVLERNVQRREADVAHV